MDTDIDAGLADVQLRLAQAGQVSENLRDGSRLGTAHVRAIARDGYRPLKDLGKAQIFEGCEALLVRRSDPERTIAFDWVFRCRKSYTPDDFDRFERWLGSYVDGWGSCDDFCTHAFGDLVYRYPQTIPRTGSWTRSENRWFRRAAAVVLVYSVRRGENLDAAFHTAAALLTDPDDMVQKGYGWLLKEASRSAPGAVFDFVMENKATMPRTALRYAIEKLASPLRGQAMAKP